MALCVFALKIILSFFAGTPATIVFGRNVFGDDCACADDCVFADRDARDNRCVRTDTRTFFDERRDHLPIRFSLRRAIGVSCTRIFVVSEHHAVADENIVLDGQRLRI